MNQFYGSVAVVTGGGSGIGAAICRALAGRGMKIAVADIDLAGAEDTVRSIRDAKGTAFAHQADVTDDGSMARLAEAVRDTYGSCHLALANAGVLMLGRLEERTWQDWQWVLSVNLFGTIRTVQTFLPMLRANPGNAHIVITGSMAGLLAGCAGKGIYNTSKHALTAYGETLREELADEGIGVSLLLPGGVKTRIVDSGRNRPADLGQSKISDADMKMVIRGLGGSEETVAPDYAVRNLIASIEQNRPWIVTHDNPQRAKIEARFAGILEAFDRAKDN